MFPIVLVNMEVTYNSKSDFSACISHAIVKYDDLQLFQ